MSPGRAAWLAGRRGTLHVAFQMAPKTAARPATAPAGAIAARGRPDRDRGKPALHHEQSPTPAQLPT
eukprot:12805033-Alexandrium_andersonii.AAC.1